MKTNYKKDKIQGNTVLMIKCFHFLPIFYSSNSNICIFSKLTFFVDLQYLVEEKELEIKVLNQMIVSANKMVQVKSLEFKRLKRKFDHKSRQLAIIAENLDPRQSHLVRKSTK